MRVHQVFVSLGLRHLCVVDAWNRVVGLVTRKDLDRAAGSGSWRRNPVFASQHRCVHAACDGSPAALLAHGFLICCLRGDCLCQGFCRTYSCHADVRKHFGPHFAGSRRPGRASATWRCGRTEAWG